jgi:hypothetical protein
VAGDFDGREDVQKRRLNTEELTLMSVLPTPLQIVTSTFL